MSRRKNYKEISANYSMTHDDVVINIATSGLIVDLPIFDGAFASNDDGINLKFTRELFFFSRDDFELNIIDGVSVFQINSGTSYTVPAGTGLAAYWYLGRWFLDFFDVPLSGGGGGITELTGDVTAGPGSGSQVATIANNAVTTAKMVQLSAYKFWANDTNASANAAEHDFRDEGETAITATITFTGTTAPSGASTLSQWWLRVGNTVFYKFMLTYATASTATTILTISFPSEFPTPFEPTGLTAASAFLYFMDYSRVITTPAGSITSNATGCLKRNAGDTANEFVFAHSSGNYRTWHMGGSYRCS